MKVLGDWAVPYWSITHLGEVGSKDLFGDGWCQAAVLERLTSKVGPLYIMTVSVSISIDTCDGSQVGPLYHCISMDDTFDGSQVGPLYHCISMDDTCDGSQVGPLYRIHTAVAGQQP